MKFVMKGSLDTISAMTSDEGLSNAANTAFCACMAGYFDNLEDESLERVEFQ